MFRKADSGHRAHVPRRTDQTLIPMAHLPSDRPPKQSLKMNGMRISTTTAAIAAHRGKLSLNHNSPVPAKPNKFTINPPATW